MNNYDFHSLFYYLILSSLQELRGTDGYLRDQFRVGSDLPNFSIAFEPQNLRGYAHNFLQDNFLKERDRLVLGRATEDQAWQHAVIVVSEKRTGDRVTIYRKALESMFGDKSKEALTELKELLEKFYEVTIEERSAHRVVDFTTGRHPSHYEINDLSRV